MATALVITHLVNDGEFNIRTIIETDDTYVEVVGGMFYVMSGETVSDVALFGCPYHRLSHFYIKEIED